MPHQLFFPRRPVRDVGEGGIQVPDRAQDAGVELPDPEPLPWRMSPPPIPQTLLDRHGARVLRPAEAARRGGYERIEPTVYRTGSLLVANALAEGGALDRLNGQLSDLRVRLVRPKPLAEVIPDADRDFFADLPRSVSLVPAGDEAVVVDAWTVLQRLRSVARDRPDEDSRAAETAAEDGDAAAADGGNPPPAPIYSDEVRRIGLEHLLLGSALSGVGTLGGENSPTNGSPAVNNPSGPARYDMTGRLPLRSAPAPRPPRTPENGRRPVVAVLDTGYYRHPWFTEAERTDAEQDPALLARVSVIVDSQWQEQILDGGRDDQNRHRPDRTLVEGYCDEPPVLEPLGGELATHFGHGTFIAGLIRQIVPDAVVFVIRVMQPDGVAYEADVLFALGLIARQAARYANGEDVLPIDVVSLSAGYFPETPEERLTADMFRVAIDKLRDLGVTMVAAAGNYASSNEFQPAALADPGSRVKAPCLSVGALNPNGTIASFSNQAKWVTCYASGVAVVSSFPPVDGSTNPTWAVPRYGRQSYDLDDFSSGIALWNGTSFATPIIAAAIAAQLARGGLAPGDGAGMPARANEAMDKLRE